jgi:hypothetical protein
MPHRVIAFFLALVLLWSGLGTIEAPDAWAQPGSEPSLAQLEAERPAGTHPGSVEDHHLDDLPMQAQNDPPPETPGLMPAWRAPEAVPGRAAPPQVCLTAGTGSPCLAGPLRPPCLSAFTA